MRKRPVRSRPKRLEGIDPLTFPARLRIALLGGSALMAAGFLAGRALTAPRIPDTPAKRRNPITDLRSRDAVFADQALRLRFQSPLCNLMGGFEDSLAMAGIARTLPPGNRSAWRDASLIRLLGELVTASSLCGVNAEPRTATAQVGSHALAVWRNWHGDAVAWMDIDTLDGVSRWMRFDRKACELDNPSWEHWVTVPEDGRTP